MFPKFVSVTYPKRLIYMAANTATNPITGDRIATKRSTTYADNYAKIDFSVKLEHMNELLKDPIDGFNNEEK
jgi:hypothetical protein